jgi:hypothetical protein
MAFIILALVAVVSAVMFLFVRKPRLPARLSVASENTQSR